MAAGGLPAVQVLLDDGTGTFPYDLTAMTVGGDKLVRVGYDLNRGRQDEQSDVTPGAIRSLVLNNTDGRFTLNSTIIATPSPIRPDNRIRVKVTPSGGTTRNRFTGYVQEWPTNWPDGSDLLCEVTLAATDAQARAERRTLRSVIEEEYLEDAPAMYYTLGDESGAVSAADTSGNQAAVLVQADAQVGGTGIPVTFGNDTGATTDGLTAAHFSGFNSNVLAAVIPFTLTAFEFTFAITVQSPSGLFTSNTAFLFSTPGFGTDGLGRLSAGTATSTAVVWDGLEHHVFVTISGGTATIYLDGVSIGTTAVTVNAGGTVWIGGGLGVPPLTGSMSHVAFHQGTPPTPARILAHAQAVLTGFDGETSTARITRTAGYANIPLGTLDTSLTNVAFKDITRASAGEALRDISDAEVGIIYVDGSGNATFLNRNRLFAKTSPDITLAADQIIDEGTGVIIDMQGVVNYFTGTSVAPGSSPQVAWNKISENGDGTVTNPGHGRYPGSKTYLVRTNQEALDRANWIVGNHADPTPRIPTLKVDLLALDAATQNALLGAEADTWIRITGLPSQTPGGTTADLVVQGFIEHMAPDAWDLTFNVIGEAMFHVWILGDATWGVLGSTTRLAV